MWNSISEKQKCILETDIIIGNTFIAKTNLRMTFD
jgi:hypothetical protein